MLPAFWDDHSSSGEHGIAASLVFATEWLPLVGGLERTGLLVEGDAELPVIGTHCG